LEYSSSIERNYPEHSSSKTNDVQKTTQLREWISFCRFCEGLNEYNSLNVVNSHFHVTLPNWSMIAIVRDPVDRFVSGFVDKCLRHFCRISGSKFGRSSHFVAMDAERSATISQKSEQFFQNLTCFMEKEYNRMMKLAAEFRKSGNFDDDHFFPQSWRCEFSSRLHDYYILKFDTFDPSGFIDDLCIILRQSNVSEPTIDFISKFSKYFNHNLWNAKRFPSETSVTSGRTTHSTKDLKERRETKEKILSSRYLTDLLIKMYYYDFVLFGFPIPEVEVKNQ
ncbi:hypothetical protein ANCCAN_08139, partial [Ancylostoma caninum]